MAISRPLRRLRGVIIHRSSVREKDRVIEAFTREEGRVRFFAPGVRHVVSRRAGHLETLMESQLVLAHSSRGDNVSEARVLKSFPRLREDYNRLETIFEAIKLIRDYLGESQKDVLLYDVLLGCMEASDKKQEPPDYLLEIVVAHILRSIGCLPDLQTCTQCRQKLEANNFSFKPSRGFECRKCSGSAQKELTDIVKLLRIFLVNKEAAYKLAIPGETLRQLRKVTRSLLRNQGGIVRDWR